MAISRRHFLLASATVPLTGCNALYQVPLIKDASIHLKGQLPVVKNLPVVAAVSAELPLPLDGEFDDPVIEFTVKVDPKVYEKEVRHLTRLRARVEQSWGKREGRVASAKVLVKYTDNYDTRCMIDFERGVVRVESLHRTHLREGIVTTVLSPLDPSKLDLFSASGVDRVGEPFLYRQFTDEDNLPVRWRWRANRFARYQMRHNLRTETIRLDNGTTRKKYAVEFPLGKTHEATRQGKYGDLVARYSRQYGQESALVYAIIETESHFNPYATSWVPAYGLMQIVPRTAGRDAYRMIHGRRGTPSRQYLFNPEQNIRMGCAYLNILQRRYLANVSNRLSLEYCMIAAYNGGAGAVLRCFSRQKSTAFSKINQLTPAQVYKVLRRKMPKESQGYLKKVTAAKKRYV